MFSEVHFTKSVANIALMIQQLTGWSSKLWPICVWFPLWHLCSFIDLESLYLFTGCL